MNPFKKKYVKPKSSECEELTQELKVKHKEFDKLNNKIRGIQSGRNGRKYVTPQADLDNEESTQS